MKNLLYAPLADSVEIAGESYKILTDFRDWLKFSDMFENREIDPKIRLVKMFDWFEELPPAEHLTEAAAALVQFCTNKEPDKSPKTGANSHKKILSWAFDSPFIYAAFLSVYGLDLLNIEYLHWHVFLALFEGLPEDTPIKERMKYRAVNLAEIKDKKERQRIRRIQERIRIPSGEMSAADIGAAFG